MLADLEKYRATSLVWSALGGGSISLPYLREEAFGQVPPRLRFYGYMNDSEFIAQCQKRGIKVFGIVFEVQGWEFTVKISKDGRSFLEFNVCGDTDQWYGLREFSGNTYDGLFPTSLRDYYPSGIVNSDGQIVKDLWEECCARTYKGEPVHAGWVECPDNAHQARQMCRNNPVWREYLKKIIALMIDAGVDGVQLDEAELPITSLKAGGCFCKDCRKQFRAYLRELRGSGGLAGWDSLDLETFDYMDFLNQQGSGFPEGAPLFREYYEFQLGAVRKYFTELADYARAYGREQGRQVLVSGNFFSCMPVYFPFRHTVDLIITEMEQTLFRQPHWYRYVNGFAGGLPVIVAENPYGGVIPELLEALDKGKGYDLYRLLLAEAAVYGCNMSVPYGGWMGSVIRDAFYPPRQVTAEFQDFLAEHEGLFTKKSGSRTALVYSFPSYYWREATKGYTGNVARDPGEGMLFYHPTDLTDERTARLPFWEILKEITDAQAVCDVVATGGGPLCPDQVTEETFAGYDLIILPDCADLTENQVRALYQRVEQGAKVLVFGRSPLKKEEGVFFAENKAAKRESLESFNKMFWPLYEQVRLVRVSDPSVGVCVHKDGTCVWLLNYGYDKDSDRVLPIADLRVWIKSAAKARVHTLGAGSREVEGADGWFTLENAGLLTIIEVTG
jgi:hypothetical protein